jgi:hypothetical protein
VKVDLFDFERVFHDNSLKKNESDNKGTLLDIELIVNSLQILFQANIGFLFRVEKRYFSSLLFIGVTSNLPLIIFTSSIR